MAPVVIIESDDGRELARITGDTVAVPMVGELVQSHDGLHVVTAVVWDLTDRPLAGVRLICTAVDG